MERSTKDRTSLQKRIHNYTQNMKVPENGYTSIQQNAGAAWITTTVHKKMRVRREPQCLANRFVKAASDRHMKMKSFHQTYSKISILEYIDHVRVMKSLHQTYSKISILKYIDHVRVMKSLHQIYSKISIFGAYSFFLKVTRLLLLEVSWVVSKWIDFITP